MDSQCTVNEDLFAGGSLADSGFGSFRRLCTNDELDYERRLALQLKIIPPEGRRYGTRRIEPLLSFRRSLLTHVYRILHRAGSSA